MDGMSSVQQMLPNSKNNLTPPLVYLCAVLFFKD